MKVIWNWFLARFPPSLLFLFALLEPIYRAHMSRCGACNLTWTHLIFVEQLTRLHFAVSNERQSPIFSWKLTVMKPAVCSFASPSGCLLLCLGLSVLTMLLQNLWMPLDITRDEPTGRSPEEQSTHSHSLYHITDLWVCDQKMTKMNSTSSIRNLF